MPPVCRTRRCRPSYSPPILRISRPPDPCRHRSLAPAPRRSAPCRPCACHGPAQSRHRPGQAHRRWRCRCPGHRSVRRSWVALSFGRLRRVAHYSGRLLHRKLTDGMGTLSRAASTSPSRIGRAGARFLTMKFKELIFSGVQPTGNLHLGNYLGAIKRFVELQDRFDCIYCVVDLHAITVWQDPSELPRAIREVTAAFLACGIDPKKNIVFNQSQVAEHAELAWIFNCVARLGWLNRMTQFKEKAGKDRENASVGL